MPIFSIIAFIALAIAGASFIIAFRGKHRYYWISAIAIYIFSFIAGFSIGQLTVGLTFIPLALAIGLSVGWINRKSEYLVFTGLGAVIGVIVVIFVDDYWTFYPFWIFPNIFS
ncbi:hypothetical protein BSK66_12455 [Paenibacillus odorifer]|uniref:hypothetical protein n=1 Tax=Paenibacillus TaxID=44249 RepID=UPI0003E22109|nr:MULTISPECIES: hypothetical protein [Paenibacillus]ETT53891.1 hypothetical protein C171_20579 [Paenibacillus sp. FSL H8-237]OME58404.1 hypothetical protein BSK66_12455 [Paenibacillus odorifer]